MKIKALQEGQKSLRGRFYWGGLFLKQGNRFVIVQAVNLDNRPRLRQGARGQKEVAMGVVKAFLVSQQVREVIGIVNDDQRFVQIIQSFEQQRKSPRNVPAIDKRVDLLGDVQGIFEFGVEDKRLLNRSRDGQPRDMAVNCALLNDKFGRHRRFADAADAIDQDRRAFVG